MSNADPALHNHLEKGGRKMTHPPRWQMAIAGIILMWAGFIVAVGLALIAVGIGIALIAVLEKIT